MRIINIWVWWVGLWVALGKVWYQIGVQLPSKCLQFVFSFRFGFVTMSLAFLFLLPFQPRSHILHWFFWWVPVRLKKISGCHFNLFFKKMNSHFGLSWKIHVGQKLTKQMTKKPTNPSAKLHKMPVRHIQGQSCCHLCTFYFFIKKNPVGATTN
jgi:hypothetical protein